MSEEFENEEFETQEEEGLQKTISMGLKPHPITREMGVVIAIGAEQTWMSVSEAKRFIGEVDITLVTAIAVGSTMNLLTKMPDMGPGGKELFVPKR